jgi:hypothetical protein
MEENSFVKISNPVSMYISSERLMAINLFQGIILSKSINYAEKN